MLGSSNTKLAVDAGNFSVKSIAGKSKGSSRFSGKIGNYVMRQEARNEADLAGSDIHHSLIPIYTKNSEIHTVTSLSDVILREVEIDKGLSDYEKEGAIEVELSESLPFSLDQVYFDFQAVNSGTTSSSEQRYLVAVSRRDIVDPLTSEIISFDKNTPDIHVDVDAYSLGRLVSQLYRENIEDEIILLIDVAHQRSRYYFYDNKGLVFHREQQIGGKYATESISEIYDLNFSDAQLLKHRDDQDKEFAQLIVKPFASAFSEQLHLVLDFFEASAKSDKGIYKIVLVGGGACLNGLVAELQSLLDKPVEIIDLSSIWPDAKPEDENWKLFSAQYALALSLLIDGVK